MTRTIQKQLAVAEDILHGVGTVQQQRGQQIFDVNKVDIPFGVSTLAQAMSQDPATYPRVRAGSVELQAIDGVYQKALDVKPTIYEAGAVLTEANPYVYYASAIYERISDLPYTLTDPANDGLGIINPAQWRLYLAAGEGGNFTFEPKVDRFTVADLDINNGYDLQNVQYQPGANAMWALARGSKLVLASDYTEPSSTRVEFTASFLATVEPDTEIEVWANLFVPATDFPLIRTTFDDTLSQLDANNGQEAIDKLKALIDDLAFNATNFVTMEQFDPDAGTGGDDTAAFEQACALSLAIGRQVLLLGSTYHIEPKLFTVDPDYTVAGILGLANSRIEPYGPLKFPAADYAILHVRVLDRGELKGFTVDAKVSQTTANNIDPVVWDSSNYDTWYGSRGIILRNSSDITIQSVQVRNTYGAGIGRYGCTKIAVRKAKVVRTRGNFGDSFYDSNGEQHSYVDCYAYDFTRIGFTADGSFVEATNFTTYENCMAIYGHDASNLYGGIESNAGFWTEYGVNATYIRCLSYDTKDSGFRAPIITQTRYNPSLYMQDAWSVSYHDCVAGKTREAFVGTAIAPTDASYVYSNCIGYDVTVGFFVGEDVSGSSPAGLIKVNIKGCKVFFASGLTVHRGVLPLGGDIFVDDLDLYYKDVPDWQAESLDPNNSNGAISWFGTGNQRPRKLHVKNVRSFRADTKQQIDSRIVQGSTTRSNEIIIENCDRIFMDNIYCFKFISRNVTYSVLGTIRASQVIDMQGGGVSAIYNVDPLLPVVVIPLYSTTFNVTIDNVRFNLSDGVAQTLYVANITSLDVYPKVRITRCRFRKNETTGSPITLNAETGIFNTQNIMRFIVEHNLFINTGGATATPLVRSQQREVGGNTVNVQVMGKGNFKSNNISANATAGVITTNFEVLPYDAA